MDPSWKFVIVHEITIAFSSSAIITLVWWAVVNFLEMSAPFMPVVMCVLTVLLVLPLYDRKAYPDHISVSKHILRLLLNLVIFLSGVLGIFFGGLSTKIAQPTNLFQMIPAFVGIASMVCCLRCVVLLVYLLISLGFSGTEEGVGDVPDDVIRRRRFSMRSMLIT